MKFSYIKIPSADPRKKWISRPIISVMLTGPKGSVIVDALIDSGADKCLFHSDLAKEIGLDLQDGKQEMFSGITGKQVVAFEHKVYLQVLEIDKKIVSEQQLIIMVFYPVNSELSHVVITKINIILPQ